MSRAAYDGRPWCRVALLIHDAFLLLAAGALHDLFFVVALVVGLGLWLLPTIVALARGAKRTTAVIIINLLLAWTVIGWIVALVMAFASGRERA